MNNFNYYHEELKQIDDKAPTISIVLHDYHGNKTKYLNLNKESIHELRLFLQRVESNLTDDKGESNE